MAAGGTYNLLDYIADSRALCVLYARAAVSAAPVCTLGFSVCSSVPVCRVCQPNIPVYVCVQPLLTEIGINSNKFNAKINIYTIPHINNECGADAEGERFALCCV